MRFTSIASGSSGNASYIGDEETHILIDVGVTQKAITEGLSALSLSLSDIDGIFLTHEHIDHIRAVGTISRRYGIPIYGTLATLRETLLWSGRIGWRRPRSKSPRLFESSVSRSVARVP